MRGERRAADNMHRWRDANAIVKRDVLMPPRAICHERDERVREKARSAEDGPFHHGVTDCEHRGSIWATEPRSRIKMCAAGLRSHLTAAASTGASR